MKQLTCSPQDGCRLARPTEADETAAVAQQGVCVLGHHAELFPALGGVGIALRRPGDVAGGFGDDGGGGDERMFGVAVVRLDAGDESLREGAVVERDGASHERGQVCGVVLGLARAGVVASSSSVAIALSVCARAA